MRSLISDSILPAGHSRKSFSKFFGRSASQRRRDRFGFLSHSMICLSSVSWHTCITESCSYLRLAPSQSASLCVFHRFMEWVVGFFYGTETCMLCGVGCGFFSMALKPVCFVEWVVGFFYGTETCMLCGVGCGFFLWH